MYATRALHCTTMVQSKIEASFVSGPGGESIHHTRERKTLEHYVSLSLHWKKIPIHSCSPLLYWPMVSYNNEPEKSIPWSMVHLNMCNRNVCPMHHGSCESLNPKCPVSDPRFTWAIRAEFLILWTMVHVNHWSRFEQILSHGSREGLNEGF